MEILYANNDLNDDSNYDKNTKYLLIKSKKIGLIFSGTIKDIKKYNYHSFISYLSYLPS